MEEQEKVIEYKKYQQGDVVMFQVDSQTFNNVILENNSTIEGLNANIDQFIHQLQDRQSSNQDV